MQESRCELSVIMPVYDEGPNIAETVEALSKNINVSHEILIVYDFDADTTLPVARRIGADFPSVRLVKNSIRRGPSGAIRTGITEAHGNRVLVAMGDHCDDFTQISALLDMVPSDADIACPSRYCVGGHQSLKWSVKKIVPRLVGLLLRTCAGIPTVDPTNSYKMYSSAVLRRFRLISTVSFSVTLEIVVRAFCAGYRIREIPTTWQDRKQGKSKFMFGRSLVAYLPWFAMALVFGRVLRFQRNFGRSNSSIGPLVESQGATQQEP